MKRRSEKRFRGDLVQIRFTKDEKIFVASMAERAGLTLGSYARQVLMGAPTPRQVRRPPVEKLELGRLISAFGHIGGNLNQIAKKVNTVKEIDAVGLAEAIGTISQLRDATLRALGMEP